MRTFVRRQTNLLFQAQGHHDSSKIPPRQLRIEDLNPSGQAFIRTTKKEPATPATPLQQYPPPPWFSSPYMGYHPYETPGHSRNGPDIPSSDPIEETEDPTLFPRVSLWLRDLDGGPRGTDGHNFSQCQQVLDANMFTRISQLDSMVNSELIGLCPGLPAGTAGLLLQYARADCSKIRKMETRRIRQAKHTPKHYE